ncbi:MULTISPECIES: exodeoxyribonuclease VII large subunit [unclassified Oceanispirochaeta]|uniref:exodeoxyribonuclease VII large subunit n=1 Tax=unclassified Oceanispirochaeta TaxID=2635722 RepID=UPI000E090035|nr:MULTISPECIES: exodeoxyribonuclease VII large subunit [unclassified Oceanispirochaeta]MBF9017668.1 exodeoxyribonuclease VII large subunit [Oceanispirochaeta sp. M2]NPD74240.1 exodeoxyribonuclease VII large subunit [Oceanispirochaeta sp. M1]RDG29946.1 exodeoxyribonuclease VII large subunit [Oceanispirochaeta sp. M1]
MNGIPSYNVSELTYMIKNTLENQFPVVRVKGEISNFRPAASGHCYFNLKDKDAVINAVLFRQQRSTLDFTPADGMSVTVIGRLSVYAQRGNYQLICESMEQSGRGDLLYQLELLKKRLEQEGLFDPELKKELPLYPRTIGAVTSARGAALQDIIQVLKRRMKSFRLIVNDTVVQGEYSAPSIVRSIESMNKRDDIDVIILARGGGSLEDLLSFSDERVVRAVAASRIPLISGVGHEIDFSLADFAADMRAPTPSAAAEIVSEATLDLEQKIRRSREELKQLLQHSMEKTRWRFSSCDRTVLDGIMTGRIEDIRQIPDLWHLDNNKLLSDRIGSWRSQTALMSETISSVSPENILARGFPLIFKDNKIINSAEQVKSGDRLSLRFRDGEKTALVEKA